MNFLIFKNAVASRFALMQKVGVLYQTETTSDEIWDTYINSFPEGSNPIYKTRTEHDCSCCKQFIRTVGNVVAFIDGQIISIWDVAIPSEPAYQVVANAMSAYVKSKKVVDQFFHYESKVGTDKNFEQLVDGTTVPHNHFAVMLAGSYIKPKDYIATIKSEIRSSQQVFERALRELDVDSIDTVKELIAQNSLYRCEDYKFVVNEFAKIKKAYDKAENKDIFVWSNLEKTPNAVRFIRNSAIGKLLVDLSEGKDLEDSVKSFEAMVAPANYKRPTALVTKKMVDDAKKTIEELGLTSALQRRYASLTDININNILFADRSAKKIISGDIFDDIATDGKKKNFDKIEEVYVEKFIKDILPTAKTVEIMVENKHKNNFVSLVTAVDPTANDLFKWSNKFSWSYSGDFADAIKEKVKAAGGNVTGDVRVSLAWYNYDDLDLHMNEKTDDRRSYEIYFGNRSKKSPNGGLLDVDMNAGGGRTRTPVENIFYQDISKMRPGTYTISVNNFSKRESIDSGFEVEIEILGDVYSFSAEKSQSSGHAHVATLTKKADGTITVEGKLKSSSRSMKVWGVNTNQWTKVSVLMNSPNYWDGQLGIGNKHYFFMLDGCVNEGNARGFYNEYLKEELSKHRKVLEIVGSKMRTEETPNQLSGVGFSSSSRNSVVLRVTGSFTREIKVVF